MGKLTSSAHFWLRIYLDEKFSGNCGSISPVICSNFISSIWRLSFFPFFCSSSFPVRDLLKFIFVYRNPTKERFTNDPLTIETIRWCILTGVVPREHHLVRGTNFRRQKLSLIIRSHRVRSVLAMQLSAGQVRLFTKWSANAWTAHETQTRSVSSVTICKQRVRMGWSECGRSEQQLNELPSPAPF